MIETFVNEWGILTFLISKGHGKLKVQKGLGTGTELRQTGTFLLLNKEETIALADFLRRVTE